ncbi:LutB/LldF family L-lactate oxidation iron-sulfur protein [Desulfosporosinus sp. BICA1-9]|uniref:LutB/LldF family L-lactate oxidation iron-sulfur protein n=1 Tax=Desulfosporosinus sp. BICA1-9 TaxID=1531958 RepID=UPI00054C56B3|nr:LutB/LldF family L-lactate oxidation iron-sulfur protein [Desulfosporosinus sp. BICA1-9]KJS46636.1 MAG: amino acid dehydrogenase [Peptococcaceae bacterium BRH_c23]KJS89699.1 MAG: amino acid dehydrogenase [Desulfosporosinus sp. BICA1-9]HBW38573.1 iron-sulfur cluster-binding protein [Desulfosporosinus sp.]
MTMYNPTVDQRVDKALADDFLRQATRRATDRLRNNKYKAADELGSWEEWRNAGASIRKHVIENLDYYLQQLIQQTEKRGVQVHLAKTPEDAVAVVRDIVRKHNAKNVIKSKSMISEEIHLNKALEADGVLSVETDLGEYIIQIAGEPPSHIIVPAMHKTRQQVADLFEPIAGQALSSDTPTLTRFVRIKMREQFLHGDIGITGCNFAVANTGSIVMVTNEGNGRMVSTLPRVQITLMGMERIVPSFRELDVMLNLLARSATGQRLSSYTTILTPPKQTADSDGPEEFHLVILDHNRSEILGDKTFRPALNCIRCGACFNVCPVYRQIGGHAYGSVYSGPIGSVITPLLEKDWEKWGHLPFFSSLCGACSEACPVHIPLHDLLVNLRARKTLSGHTPQIEQQIFKAFRYFFTHEKTLRRALRLGSRLQWPFVRNGRISGGPPPLSNWTKSRTLPMVAPKSFMQIWADSKASRKSPH